MAKREFDVVPAVVVLEKFLKAGERMQFSGAKAMLEVVGWKKAKDDAVELLRQRGWDIDA